jgi:hypothetical protein
VLRAGPTPTPASSGSNNNSDKALDLPLFLLGSGFALFIGLLAWADQIRGVTKDTHDVLERYLQRVKVPYDLFKEYQRAKPENQLMVFMKIARAADFQTGEDVKAVERFNKWISLLDRLTSMVRRKFWVSLFLMVSLMVSGAAAALFTDRSALSVCLILLAPATLFAFVVVLMFQIGRDEDEFFRTFDPHRGA